jgi:hypothetical protein
MAGSAIGMGMRNLNRACDHDQKHTHQREEYPPRLTSVINGTVGARCLALIPH